MMTDEQHRNLTGRMARFVVGSRELPDPALKAAVNALIETVGCAIAGGSEPVVDISRKWALAQSAAPVASIWGSAIRTSAFEAALANGIAAHVHDFDDAHPHLRAHPSTTLIPALLAYAEWVGSNGADVLKAYCLGLEVAAKLTRAIGPDHYLRGWHNTVTIGVISCATAVAHLARLDETQMRVAWGLAASMASGMRRNFGTMTKSFHAGHAARIGIQCAWEAQHGFTADPSIFEGENNFLSMYGASNGEPLEALIESMGQPWEIISPGNYHKRWPCCGEIHRSLVGCELLQRQHGIRADEVEHIRIGFAPGSDAALIYDSPQSGLEGKFSVQYCVAAFVLDGELTLASFGNDKVHRPQVRDLLRRVERYSTDDPKKDYSGLEAYTDVEIVTRRGSFARRIEASDDRPARVVTDAEHDEKFRACVEPIFGAAYVSRFLERARSFASMDHIAQFREVLSVP